MPSRIEDYAFIGDCQTGALVAREGSIDWLCFPRFDSEACFAALLGSPEHGRWLLAPKETEIRKIHRRYLENTLILETVFETDQGEAAVIDFMPPRGAEPDVVRIVRGIRGTVRFGMELVMRFDYGSVVPWVRTKDHLLTAVAGPDAIRLTSPVKLEGRDFRTHADFTVAEGQRVPFVFTWFPSHQNAPAPVDAEVAFQFTQGWWEDWCVKCQYEGRWHRDVMRSLITLKSLTYLPTGGIVAAPTTSLPEQLGGVRNWDYRYCWLRDATFTLYALMVGGYTREAQAWRDWLVRAVAGMPSQMQILYGLAGERRLTEIELPWLPGYEGAKPVRIGNAASDQHQLDVYGEVMDVLHIARRHGLEPDENAWRVQRELMDFLESNWEKPDEGIWEVRGPSRQFVHSKVMAWVAADRAVKAVERFRLDGPADRWRKLRDAIHAEVCHEGFNRERNSFVQYYGADHVDGSLLFLPLVGFLSATDPRMKGTVEAIERDLMRDGFVQRYPPRPDIDGLPPGEGAFLACTFWYVDNLTLQGRYAEAEQEFERLLGLCNDVGLLSEEYDPDAKRLVGNFPQAFSHVSLINSARNLDHAGGPAEARQTGIPA